MRSPLNSSFLSFFTLLFLAPSVESAVKYCGHVVSFYGTVEVHHVKEGEEKSKNPIRQSKKVKPRQAKRKMKLECSDIIVTRKRSRVKIALVRSVITIGPNSRMRLDKYSPKPREPKVVDLVYGQVRAFFRNDKKEKADKDAEANFKVQTKAAVMGVRGTDFFVSYDPNTAKAEQATLEGVVEVKQKITEQKVLVKSGEQVVVESLEEKVEKEVKELKKEQVKIDKKFEKEFKKKTLAELKKKALAQPIKVAKISAPVTRKIQQASILVRKDKVFTSSEALKVLGDPQRWLPPKDEIPDAFKELKNEF